MGGVSKPKPMAAFNDNMADAHALVRLAEALVTNRTYRMRKEMRTKIGNALRIPQKRQDLLDCVHSDALYITLLPGSGWTRSDFQIQEPLLRQALVAGCAATETFLADRVTECCRRLTNDEDLGRIGKISMTVAQWQVVNRSGYPRRAIADKVIAPHVALNASTAASKVGELLALVEIDHPMTKLDSVRRVAKGTTESELERITARRNQIAHQGDRSGRRRAHITREEVVADLAALESIVQTIDGVLA